MSLSKVKLYAKDGIFYSRLEELLKIAEYIELALPALKDILVERYLFELKNPENRLRSIYLEGHAGIGKSQLVRQVAEAVSQAIKEPVQCQVLNLQFCERPDFMGLPRIDENGNTVYARPSFLPKEGLGILFLDEANRVDPDIQSGMLTLLEDRCVNGHEIGKSWMIILAGNPESAGDGSRYKVNEFDLALQDRIATVKVTGNVPDLIKFLEKKYSNHILLKFLDYFPDFISFDGQGCSPRSFEYAMRSTIGINDIKNPIFYRNISIELGSHSATHIIGVLESGFIPTIKNVLEKDPRVYSFLTDNGNRQDVLLSLIDQIYKFITVSAEKNTKLNPDEVSAVIEFLMLTQDEHRIALFEKIRGSKYSVYFGQYFLKNTRLAEVLYAKRATAS